MPRTPGDFEVLILLAIVRLGEGAYGASIHQEIEDRSRRSIAVGAVYTGLARLAKSGYVESSVGDPTPERGGRRKKFYRLRPAGAEALTRSLETHRRMVEGIESELAELVSLTGGGNGS